MCVWVSSRRPVNVDLVRFICGWFGALGNYCSISPGKHTIMRVCVEDVKSSHLCEYIFTQQTRSRIGKVKRNGGKSQSEPEKSIYVAWKTYHSLSLSLSLTHTQTHFQKLFASFRTGFGSCQTCQQVRAKLITLPKPKYCWRCLGTSLGYVFPSFLHAAQSTRCILAV